MDKMIQCRLCNKSMNWIQNTHLAKHGITTEKYKEMFPDAPMKSEQMTKTLKDTRWGDYKPKQHRCANPECKEKIHYKKKYCSNSCRGKVAYVNSLGEYATTEGNPNYAGGEHAYCKSQKQSAFIRDNSKCVKCGKGLECNEKYGVHHLIPRRLIEDKKVADKLENLVTLCGKCHRETETRFADEIFKLYSNHDYKSVDDLMLYLRSKI